MREQSNRSPYRGRPMRRERQMRSHKAGAPPTEHGRRLILRPLHPLPLYVTVLLVVVTVAAFRRYLDGGTIGQTGCHHPLFSLPDSCSPHPFASTCPPSLLSVAYAPSLFRWTAGSFDLSLLPRTPPLPSLVSINVPASTTLRGYLPSPYRFPSSAHLLLPPASPFPLCILVLYRPP